MSLYGTNFLTGLQLGLFVVPQKTFQVDFSHVWVYGGTDVGAGYNDYLFCFRRDTGKFLWRFGDRESYHDLLSPTVLYKNQIFVARNNGLLYSLDAQTGETIWRFSHGTYMAVPFLLPPYHVFYKNISNKFVPPPEESFSPSFQKQPWYKPIRSFFRKFRNDTNHSSSKVPLVNTPLPIKPDRVEHPYRVSRQDSPALVIADAKGYLKEISIQNGRLLREHRYGNSLALPYFQGNVLWLLEYGTGLVRALDPITWQEYWVTPLAVPENTAGTNRSPQPVNHFSSHLFEVQNLLILHRADRILLCYSPETKRLLWKTSFPIKRFTYTKKHPETLWLLREGGEILSLHLLSGEVLSRIVLASSSSFYDTESLVINSDFLYMDTRDKVLFFDITQRRSVGQVPIPGDPMEPLCLRDEQLFITRGKTPSRRCYSLSPETGRVLWSGAIGGYGLT